MQNVIDFLMILAIYGGFILACGIPVGLLYLIFPKQTTRFMRYIMQSDGGDDNAEN